MPIRFSVTLSDRLNKELEEVVGPDDESKTVALKKAVMLYIAARRAVCDGHKVGIARNDADLVTEFINL